MFGTSWCSNLPGYADVWKVDGDPVEFHLEQWGGRGAGVEMELDIPKSGAGTGVWQLALPLTPTAPATPSSRRW